MEVESRDLYNVNDLEIQKSLTGFGFQLQIIGGDFKGAPGGRFWYSDDGTNFTKATPNYPEITINQGQI